MGDFDLGDAFDSAKNFVTSGGLAGPSGLDLAGSHATNAAIQAQTEAANQANETQKYMYNTTRSDLQPWRQAGQAALGQMQDPSFQQTFNASTFQTDPGYQFRMAEGQKAIERAANARGNANSGATLKSLTDYNQNTASQEYQNAYNRFNNDQTNRFNRLAAIAGVGQTANTQIGQAGQNYANNVANNQIGLGNGIASANISQANRTSNLMGQGLGAAVVFSDERLKTNIEPMSKEDLMEMKSFLKALHFNYVKNEFGEGDWMGVMAQDLEKSKLGKTLVFENEQGHKMINIKKVMSLFLATMAEA